MMNAETLIETLELQAHPEGGYFKELYRSTDKIPHEVLSSQGMNGERNYCTSIYFLLTANNFSAFHRIKQDEIWHFYKGAPLDVHVIDANGNYSCLKLGLNFENGERPQGVVPAGCWFASSVAVKEGYSLVGCTVAPGFDFEDFELAQREDLQSQYPKHKELIERLTRL